jgi:hypothetical protein
MRHRAVELRRRARIEGCEPQYDGLTELNLIDVLGIDLHFDHEIVALRHDQHDRITGRDHAADRIGRRLKDDAILRGADVGALERILRGDLALDKLADFAVDITQLLSERRWKGPRPPE